LSNPALWSDKEIDLEADRDENVVAMYSGLTE